MRRGPRIAYRELAAAVWEQYVADGEEWQPYYYFHRLIVRFCLPAMDLADIPVRQAWSKLRLLLDFETVMRDGNLCYKLNGLADVSRDLRAERTMKEQDGDTKSGAAGSTEEYVISRKWHLTAMYPSYRDCARKILRRYRADGGEWQPCYYFVELTKTFYVSRNRNKRDKINYATVWKSVKLHLNYVIYGRGASTRYKLIGMRK